MNIITEKVKTKEEENLIIAAAEKLKSFKRLKTKELLEEKLSKIRQIHELLIEINSKDYLEPFDLEESKMTIQEIELLEEAAHYGICDHSSAYFLQIVGERYFVTEEKFKKLVEELERSILTAEEVYK